MDSTESQKTLRILSSKPASKNEWQRSTHKITSPVSHVLHFSVADEVTAKAKTTYESLLTASMQTLSAAAREKITTQQLVLQKRKNTGMKPNHLPSRTLKYRKKELAETERRVGKAHWHIGKQWLMLSAFVCERALRETKGVDKWRRCKVRSVSRCHKGNTAACNHSNL